VAGFRNDNDLDLPKIVTSLGVGEAVVSALDEQGTPTSAVAISIAPPESRIGPLTAEERAQKLADSPLAGRYDQLVDRESAHEILIKRAEGAERERADAETRARQEKQAEADRKAQEKEEAARERREEQEARRDDRSRSRRQSAGEAFLKSAASSIGRSLGNKIVRGILGSILK